MYDPQEVEIFFFYFFVFGVPSFIAACNPHLKISIGLRLAGIGAFLMAVFAIVRVFIVGVPEHEIFVF